MNRRRFLVGTAAGAAAIAGITTPGLGQGQPPAQTPAPPPQGQGGRGGGGGRGRGGPANVAPAKLARLGMMTLNHGSMLKLPWNTTPNENQTLSVLDLPQYYIDTYGIRDVEFQNSHLAQGSTDPDPAFFRELKAKFDAVGSRANQINIEIGTISNLTPEARATWLTRGKKWVDVSPILGIKRLMLNQGQLTEETKAGVISVWKELQDYAKPKGIMISAETRGSGAPGRGAPGAPPPTPLTPAARTRAVWGILLECIEAAGGYSNLDFGGAGRFVNQQELHDALKGMLTTSAGSMHIKSSPDWDIGLAVRYAESLGFKGLYTIEVNPDPAIRIVYNTILAALA